MWVFGIDAIVPSVDSKIGETGENEFKKQIASIKISIIATDITIVGINGNGLVVDSNTDMVKTAGGEEDDDAAKYASRKGDRNDDWIIRVIGDSDREVIVIV